MARSDDARAELPAHAAVSAPERPDPFAPGGQCAYGLDAPLASEHLLRGRREVAISHNGTLYRLRATRLGKLILTK